MQLIESEFLKVCEQFRLGNLITEQPHPVTVGMAEAACADPVAAIGMLHEVDRQALATLSRRLGPLAAFVADLRSCWRSGGRLYLVGCGATGRLSLAIETIAREAWLTAADCGRIIGFMAGGDAALIRSIEAFEDHPEFGQRQLEELGFSHDDLLIAITEGGETPFVIGACNAAAAISRHPAWFLYCNPTDLLCRTVERSRDIIHHPNVRPFCLEVGPMALSGSTRMQASTVQMLVAGAAISEALGHDCAHGLIERFSELVDTADFAPMAGLIEAEASLYQNGDLVLYETNDYGISVLTDTTERAPTFSLAPFENRYDPAEPASWCYLSVPAAVDALCAWRHLLRREPRTLEWEGLQTRTGIRRLLGYDISRETPTWRGLRHGERSTARFRVDNPGPRLQLLDHAVDLGVTQEPLLLRHLMLKIALNLHSTMVMGRMKRYESNLMTFVRPSNYKLIDRAARYLQNRWQQQHGEPLPYPAAVKQVFANL